MRRVVTAWRRLQDEWSADARYRRYVAHHERHHPGQPVLDRAEFYRDEQQRKWQGLRRCC